MAIVAKERTRQARINAELERYVSILADRSDTIGVIVFGSSARKETSEYSDIDLVWVKESDLPFCKRLRELRHILNPRIGADLLVYTKEELEQMAKERPFVREEILNKGKILYERERGTLASLRT